jgi:hypothetical protein
MPKLSEEEKAARRARRAEQEAAARREAVCDALNPARRALELATVSRCLTEARVASYNVVSYLLIRPTSRYHGIPAKWLDEVHQTLLRHIDAARAEVHQELEDLLAATDPDAAVIRDHLHLVIDDPEDRMHMQQLPTGCTVIREVRVQFRPENESGDAEA